MNYSELEKLNYTELKKMSEKMGIKPNRSKEETLKGVINAFKEYESYKKNKIDKYTKLEQLGNKGSEGITYSVTIRKNTEQYAMKTFKKQKSSDKIRQEVKLQEQSYKVGISPRIIEFDTVSKYIVMEKMDKHLTEVMETNNGILSKEYQKQIINIYKKLDKIGVFHNDPNLLNYMFKNKQLYIIDFGMSKKITNELVKKLGTSTPNLDLMNLSLILTIKKSNCPPQSYEYLARYLSDEQKTNFNI